MDAVCRANEETADAAPGAAAADDLLTAARENQ